MTQTTVLAVHPTVDLDAEAMGRALAHAEILSVPVPGTDARGLPDGAAQLTYLDPTGAERQVEVTRWRRLDTGCFVRGTEIQVDVQARQLRDLRLPAHHVSGHLRLTHNQADRAQVLVGDPKNPASWVYGVVFSGAVLVDAAVILDTF